MVTTTTSLLHDIEEYFADHNVKPGSYPRLNPTGLLRRAHELIEDLEDKVYTLERRPRRVEDFSDDNDDS
jgi:hypothetical protein